MSVEIVPVFLPCVNLADSHLAVMRDNLWVVSVTNGPTTMQFVWVTSYQSCGVNQVAWAVILSESSIK